MSEQKIKSLASAWSEDSERADDYLARYYAGTKADDEIAALTKEQTLRLAELYCGPLDDPDTTAWLLKAEKLGNPHAKDLLDQILPGRYRAEELKQKAAEPVPPALPAMQEEVNEPAAEPVMTAAEPAPAEPEPVPVRQASQPVSSGTKQKKKKSGGSWLIRLLVIAILCAGAYLGYRYWEATRIVTVDVSRYIDFTVSGRDTRGTASATIDAQSMTQDSGRLVNSDVIGLTISKNQGLSNGDTVTVEVTVNEENAKQNRVAFTNTVVEYTVDGLDSMDQVDVFEDIEVSFSGENGKGTVSVVSTSSDPFLSSVKYVCEPAENLSNGDVIIVKAVVDDEIIQKYQKKPEVTEKEATVVSLSRYAAGRYELTDVAYGKLYDEGVKSINKNLLSNDERYTEAALGEGTEKLEDAKLVDAWITGLFFITPNAETADAQFRNRVIVIYGLKTDDSGQKGREFEYPVVFENALFSDDDLVNYKDISTDLRTWTLTGETVTDVYQNAVSGYGTDYTVDGEVLEEED